MDFLIVGRLGLEASSNFALVKIRSIFRVFRMSFIEFTCGLFNVYLLNSSNLIQKGNEDTLIVRGVISDEFGEDFLLYNVNY